jgi:hypothetical protein
MKDGLQNAYELASRAAERSQEKQKKYYDLKDRGKNIEVGHRIMAFDGKHKLANKWEEDPCVALEIPNPDIPIYVVRKENEEGRKRTLHMNLLNSSFEEPAIRNLPFQLREKELSTLILIKEKTYR